ncbi:putative iron transporter [Candidatus Ichthyocystis hellenicum]|uniref:Putative iron transporter n=2 Tax=Candidatus Ichthyocystis TaxID=2929841 RepID=A0A0S4M728_9BURK|nr:FTR1 family protein [Candidatus Ichthyocystis hellenicum]CUT18061.1 putative iron transporter [Candidatus Ichthyocystis hellenicum]
MYSMFMLTLREGIESFMIVAITASYLKQTGRSILLKSVFLGVLSAVLLSSFLGFKLSEYAVQPISEGFMAITAAFLVLFMLIFMKKAASGGIRRSISNRIDEVSSSSMTLLSHLGVFLITMLMITREGMEVAFMVSVLIHQSGFSSGMLLGAALGVFSAFLLGVFWLLYGSRVNLQIFFGATASFLYMFCFQLFFYAFHEFSEAGVLPLLDNDYWHNLTEVYGPEGVYGSYYTYLMVIVPAIYLFYNLFKLGRSNFNKGVRGSLFVQQK